MMAFISLEAPSRSLLEQLMGDNRMPHLAAIQQKGKIVDFASPFLDGSVYATPYTRVGQRCCGERMPVSLTSALSEVVTSGRRKQGALEVPGQDTTGKETFGQPSQHHLLHLRKVLIEAPDRLASAVERLVAEQSPDVLWAHMAAIHLAGHQLWDPASVDVLGRSPTGRGLLENSLIDVYRAADAALGRIMNALPDNADVLVFWAKGMGPETYRSDLLPGMLERILEPDSPSRKSSEGDTLTRLRSIVPASLRSKVADALPDVLSLQLTAPPATIGKDWEAIRAFALPSDGPELVRLNLRGRERDGIVPESEAQALCDKIATGLRTFCDVDGKECIAGIDRPGDHLPPGRKLDCLPDLVIRWRREQATNLRGVISPVYGHVWRQGAGSGRSGNHISGARAIIVSRSGIYHAINGQNPHLVDLSATACAAAGVPYDDLPGQSLLGYG